MNKLIITMLAILLVPFVTGIGIGPAVTNIAFEPELTNQYSINIYNNEMKSFEASLILEGELSEYIIIESEEVMFSAEDEQKKIYFDVSFPRDVPPGVYKGNIRITEKPAESEGTIVALLGITHNIILSVPAHGKFIKETIQQTEDAININIKNIGIKEIEHLEVSSRINDENDEWFSTDSITNLLSDEEFNTTIIINQPSGVYHQIISIIYDEVSKNITRSFLVGQIEVLIDNFKIKEFETGKIAPINISLTSNWNKELKVFVEIEVFQGEELITTINSPDITISNQEQTTLFWETEGLNEGEYKLVSKVKLSQNKLVISEKEQTILLGEETIKIKSEKDYDLVILIILTMILFILIILLLNKKHKNRG